MEPHRGLQRLRRWSHDSRACLTLRHRYGARSSGRVAEASLFDLGIHSKKRCAREPLLASFRQKWLMCATFLPKVTHVRQPSTMICGLLDSISLLSWCYVCSSTIVLLVLSLTGVHMGHFWRNDAKSGSCALFFMPRPPQRTLKPAKAPARALKPAKAPARALKPAKACARSSWRIRLSCRSAIHRQGCRGLPVGAAALFLKGWNSGLFFIQARVSNSPSLRIKCVDVKVARAQEERPEHA